LAVVACIELISNRIVLRLIHLDFLQPRSGFTRVADLTALFSFELLSVLAVLMLAAAILRVTVAGVEFRPGARASLPLIGSVFLVLASLGILVGLPPSLLFHLHLSFLFLTLLIALSILASPASASVKAGGLLLIAVIALKLVPGILVRFGVIGEQSSLRTDVLPHVVNGLTALAGLCFVPRRAKSRLAAVMTWIVVCAAALLIRRDWETAARVAGYGFGIDLPLQPWGQLICLAALASLLYASLRLLSQPGVHRLRGWGLVLLGLGGLQLEHPAQLAMAALGLLAIATSAVRADGNRLSREAFEQLVRRGAAALGAPQVTMTGAHGHEIARLHSPAGDGLPVQVVIARRAGAVAAIEVSVGETPPRDPPFSVERREARGLGPHAAGTRVETEDREFDRAFDVYDKRGAGAPLLDAETRARLAVHVLGWLGVWPQRGLRYKAEALPPGDDALPALIAFLRELATRTA
jgi:hypothetical protein